MYIREDLIKKHLIPLLVIILFISSSISPMVIGYEADAVSEVAGEAEPEITVAFNNGPMDSPWPMYCHDTRHTCQSQYNSDNITGIEKWRFKIDGYGAGEASPVIDNNGNIYLGSDKVYSLFSNGTLNWRYNIFGSIRATCAIDEDGIIYVPTTNSYPSYIYALDLNGSEIWKYQHEWENPRSSPAIGEDGTIYFGDLYGWFYAMNPNGTLKWRYKTDEDIYSSPAIGEDGAIYCISAYHADGYLYAFYPNGSLKWKKEDVIRYTDVSISDDGSIYYLSWDKLYAVNSDGSILWSTPVDYGTTPAISNNGIIYVGYECIEPSRNRNLTAFNSENGTFLWLFNPGNKEYVFISTPAISADGIIYFTTTIGRYWGGKTDYVGGEIIALNSDGTERWREWLTDDNVFSIPTIGEDGTVYVISEQSDGCYIHAFGPIESNSPPNKPTISGETIGNVREENEYKLHAIDPDNNPISFYINWGDGFKGWTTKRASGENCTFRHLWLIRGNYTIKVKARDTLGEESDWAYLEVTMPKNQSVYLGWLERFPLLEQLINRLMERCSL